MTSLSDCYRSSTESREILKILQASSSLKGNFIWQSDSISKNVIPLRQYEVDYITREVVITLDTNRYKINQSLPLFIKLDYRTTVFKVEIYKQGKNLLSFPFPEKAKTLELRNTPRYKFSEGQEKYVSLRPSAKSVSLWDNGAEINFRVSDISPIGLGLMVSEQNRTFLKNNRVLWITKLQEVPLEEAVLAEVVYLDGDFDSKYSKRKQKEIKVGLKLVEPFPPDKYKQFIS